MNLKRTVWAAGALAALAGLAAAGTALKKSPVGSARRAPTARVERGSLKLDVRTTGAFRAARVVPLSAPSAGGGLRLIRLADTGTPVRAGDVVMEFDPAEQQYALDQALSELAEAEQQVIRRKADIEARIAQDDVGLLNARYRVRRAELDAKTPERLLSANDFQKRKLTLEEMKRRLAQTEHDVVSNRTTLDAALTVVEQARNRSRIQAERARQIIDSLVVQAPIDGLVLVRENRDATGGVFFSGMSLPEYRVGDTVWSGRVIADVTDTSDLEITVRVNEQERAALVVGQAATVQADGLPGKAFGAHITAMSGVALRSRDQQGPLRQFEVTLRLDTPEPRLRPGTTARVLIAGPEVKNVLTVPRQAVYRQGGKSVVYLSIGDRFEPREVKVTHQSANRTAIEGVTEGSDVALVNPAGAAMAASGTPAAGPAAGPAPAPPAGGPRGQSGGRQ
jgi:multidrug resistance efflux pump